MLSPDLLNQLVGPYGLHAEDLVFLRKSQNSVYRARRPSDGGVCIIRISEGRHRTQAEVETELKWVSHLAERGVSVCAPLPTLAGERCVALRQDESEYVVACFEHAPGQQIAPRSDDLPRHTAEYRQLGRLLGHLHREAVPYKLGDTAWLRPSWYESRLLCQDVAAMEDALGKNFCRSLDTLVAGLRQSLDATIGFGLVHGDVSFNNCHFEGTLPWLFDFDNCEYGSFLQDIATVLYDSIYCKALNRFADAELHQRMLPPLASFLEGYSCTGIGTVLDGGLITKFFLLREAIIYVHYHRTLDVENLPQSFRDGMEVMRRNVESLSHQVNVCSLLSQC
ncbi:phosphotransferase [Roseimicrobium sp. ORNL1]|uniref:phosphotransferase enzyme family protein n=1 Tax=Roseimicrobium sp. ORNL1 TaxID=2711231 RepID=UPI0013E1E4D8|nr:phosphotransferase [Roseimicrobium sp. ORNL1]QIF04349.1 phosphotransferase [Roseimicrobium sp. ORNL1]